MNGSAKLNASSESAWAKKRIARARTQGTLRSSGMSSRRPAAAPAPAAASRARRGLVPLALVRRPPQPDTRAAELLLDPEQPVVVGGAHLAGVQPDREVADRAAVAARAAGVDVVAVLVGEAARRQRLADRADLGDLQHHRAGRADLDPAAEALGVGREQVVADDLDAERAGRQRVALEVVLVEWVLERDDRVGVDQLLQRPDLAVAVALAGPEQPDVPVDVALVVAVGRDVEVDAHLPLVAEASDRLRHHVEQLPVVLYHAGQARAVVLGHVGVGVPLAEQPLRLLDRAPAPLDGRFVRA